MNLMRLRTMQKQAQQIINQDGLFWEKKNLHNLASLENGNGIFLIRPP
jgi:hypothetical protein